MVDVVLLVTCCLQADVQLKSVGLVQRSAAVWSCSAFIAWTGWILAMNDDSTINIILYYCYYLSIYLFIYLFIYDYLKLKFIFTQDTFTTVIGHQHVKALYRHLLRSWLYFIGQVTIGLAMMFCYIVMRIGHSYWLTVLWLTFFKHQSNFMSTNHIILYFVELILFGLN